MMPETDNADVLVLAAGFGNRLRPLTDHLPKPLIEVCGRTLLDRNLELLARNGLRRVIVNLHYRARQIREFVGDGSKWGLEVCFAEEPVILDTGGAIKNIEPLLRHDYLLTLNSDILIAPDFPLAGLLRTHVAHQGHPLVTMVLRHDSAAQDYGEIGIDQSGRVVRFLGHDYGPVQAVQSLMFLGIEVLSRELLKWMPEAGHAFSITRDIFPKVLRAEGFISSFIFDGFWADIGTSNRLREASKTWQDIFGIS
ncbi:MAG TPA: nucleotidyltransferase family protein [Oligoflexia bacterium]|nr:nucleotidyltransferase family protein [Oligoflexia bacterium]